MEARENEEKRLQTLSDQTSEKGKDYANGTDAYVRLLQELDNACNDQITDSQCASDSSCKCILCITENQIN